MAGSVYKMFRARMKEAWYQLSKEQQDVIDHKMEDAVKQFGVKRVVVCDSSWYSEQWPFWGVEEFPSLEAVQGYATCLAEMEWFRYCDSEIMLGTGVTLSATENPS